MPLQAVDVLEEDLDGEVLRDPEAGRRREAKTKHGLDPAHDYTSDTSCLPCHTTGYGKPGGYPALVDGKAWSEEETARAAKRLGVQCESCHGPGSAYKKKKTMADHDKSVAAGMLEAGKDEKTCTGCHNDQSPTWDAEKGFDFEKRKEDIAHPIPKDVKGRYLEAEKEAKGGSGGDDEEE